MQVPDFSEKHPLAYQGFYFQYRPSMFSTDVLYASLYREGVSHRLDDLRVTGRHGQLPHEYVIDYFNERIAIGAVQLTDV